MSFGTRSWTQLGFVRQYPFDLGVVSLAAIVAFVLITSYPDGNPIRLFATFSLALFLPGYALVSVLFPGAKRTEGDRADPDTIRPAGVDVLERLGLSLVLSLALVPTAVLLLPVTPWGLGTEPIAASLGLFTIVFAQIGVVRRLQTPPSARFVVSPVDAMGRLRRQNTLATVASMVLVAAIGLAVSAVLVGFLVPASAGGFTELGLYTETEDGDLVAGEIPDEVSPGDSVPVTVALENHEGERTDYSVVIEEQVVDDEEVTERTELERLDATAADGETVTTAREITPTVEANETVKIAVYAYHDEPPAEPTADNAEVDTNFWVTVDESDV